MAVLQIPATGDDANFNLQVVLDGQTYGFEFRFNDRDQSWSFNILSVDGVAIRRGIKIVPNFILTRKIASPLIFPGGIVASDTRQLASISPPGLAQLGTDVFFTYVESGTSV